MKVRKAVIPIAGFGTRFLPITKAVAKEMLPIIDKPIIHYVVEEAVQSGIEEILFVTNSYKKEIEDYFDNFYELEHKLKKDKKHDLLKVMNEIPKVRILYTRQGVALGTAHAISKAKDFVGNEPFAVLFADNIIKGKPALKELIEVYKKYNCNVVGVQEVNAKDIYKYGMVDHDDDYKIKRIIEKPEVGTVESRLASFGRYVLKPEIFTEIEKTPLRGTEYCLTDSMELLMKYQDFYACHFSGTCYDTGSQVGYLKAILAYALDDETLKKEILKINE